MGKRPKRLVSKSYIDERLAEISINYALKWQNPPGGSRNIYSISECEEEIIKEATKRYEQICLNRIEEEQKIKVGREPEKNKPKKKPKKKKKHRVVNKYTKAHRGMALMLADYKCEKCGDSDELHVHHMKYRSKGGTDDISNLIVLCELCHLKEHEGEPVHNLMLSNYRKRLALK